MRLFCNFAPDMEKIFDDGLPSQVEAWYSGLPTAKSASESDIIVNPIHDGYVGKTIIINSPAYSGDVRKLAATNNVISRFPFPGVDNVQPYDVKVPLNRLRVNVTDDLTTPWSLVCSSCSQDGMDVSLGRLCTGLESGGHLTYLGYLYRGMCMKINCRTALVKFIKSWRARMECLYTPSGTKLRLPYISPEQDTVVSVPSRSGCYFGPVLGPRRPNKKMNVKPSHSTQRFKFKTYRITDAFRSYDIRYAPGSGYYLFDKLDRMPSEDDVRDFSAHGGMAFACYLMYYFIKKNHFNSVSGGLLQEQFDLLTDREGKMSLHFTLFPDPADMGPGVFKMSLFGLQKSKERVRKTFTINYNKNVHF